jgi:hypothetical protein
MVRRRRRPHRREVYSINVGYPPNPPAQKYLPKILYPDRFEDETSFALEPPFEGWRGELIWSYATYHGRMVDWALMLYVVRADAPIELATKGPRERRQVERVDCCDSQIHRHLFTINSDPEDNDGEREVFRQLSANDADIVDSEFNFYFDMMIKHWSERVRRWLNG